MRSLALASLSALLLLVPSLPLASADAVTDAVQSHQTYDPVARTFCSSNDPLLAVTSTDLTSTLSAVPTGTGSNTFTLHLDATLPDEVNGMPACSAIDLVFTSDVAWPPAPNWHYGAFSATCGLSGTFMVYVGSTQTYFRLFFGSAPADCGLPMSQGEIDGSMYPLHPQTAAVCSPLVLATCDGAWSESYPYGCNGVATDRFTITAGLTLVIVTRSCQWQDMREHVTVSDGIGIVFLDTTSDSCDVGVADPMGVIGTTTTSCPTEVGSVVYGTDWAHILP